MTKTAKRRLGRVGRFFLSFLLIFSMTAAVMYKEPVTVAHATGVEAVLVGAAAGTAGAALAPAAGAVIVAAAAAALGIGISAAVTGRSYQQTCEDTWNRISLQAKAGIVVAGTAARPIIKMSQQAILGVSAAIQAAIGQRAAVDSIISQTGIKTLSISGDTNLADMKSKFGFTFPNSFRVWQDFGSSSTPEIVADTTLSNVKVLDFIKTGGTYFTYPLTNNKLIDVSVSRMAGDTYMLPYINVWDDKSNFYPWGNSSPHVIFDSKSVSVGTNSLGTLLGYGFIISYILNNVYHIGVMTSSGDIINVPSGLLTGSTDTGTKAIDDGVINTSDKAFYAREISALNTKIDDLESRLEAAQGKQAGDGIDVYPPVAPTVPAGDADWWNRIRTKTQPQVLDIPADTVTPADKAKDDATNTDKDTTQVPDIPDTPSSGTPSASTPSKITDITGGIPNVVSGVNGGFNGLNDLFKYLSDFFKFLAKAFSMFPAQISVVIIAVVVIAVVVRIFGRGGD